MPKEEGLLNMWKDEREDLIQQLKEDLVDFGLHLIVWSGAMFIIMRVFNF